MQLVSCVRVPPTQYHVGHARVCHPGSASRRISVTASLGSASRRFYPSMSPWPSVIATRRCWCHHGRFTRQGCVIGSTMSMLLRLSLAVAPRVDTRPSASPVELRGVKLHHRVTTVDSRVHRAYISPTITEHRACSFHHRHVSRNSTLHVIIAIVEFHLTQICVAASS